MYAAGAGDALVATVAYSDQPPAAARLPRVGDAFRVDRERLAAARPDLVLAWDGFTAAPVVAGVAELGYRVVVLGAARLDDIGPVLRRIGRLAGTSPAADAAADAYERRLAALRARYAGRAPVRVFYQVAAQPLFTVGGPHPLSDAIALCGGVNVFAGIDAQAPVVGVEAVLGSDPQVIVGGVHPLPPDGGLGDLAGWTRWPQLAAVRDGHVYPLDASLMGRPTPRMLDGVERLCERIDAAR